MLDQQAVVTDTVSLFLVWLGLSSGAINWQSRCLQDAISTVLFNKAVPFPNSLQHNKVVPVHHKFFTQARSGILTSLSIYEGDLTDVWNMQQTHKQKWSIKGQDATFFGNLFPCFSLEIFISHDLTEWIIS